MDFALEWNLSDARLVTRAAHRAYSEDPQSDAKRRALTAEGLMYTRSLEVLNGRCMDELAAYRRCLHARAGAAERERALDALYERYCCEMDKRSVADKMLSLTGFVKSVLF